MLFHYGNNKGEVYKYLYGTLHFGNKIGLKGQTLVYPMEVREAVRSRFPDEIHGKSDSKYQEADPKVIKRPPFHSQTAFTGK